MNKENSDIYFAISAVALLAIFIICLVRVCCENDDDESFAGMEGAEGPIWNHYKRKSNESADSENMVFPKLSKNLDFFLTERQLPHYLEIIDLNRPSFIFTPTTECLLQKQVQFLHPNSAIVNFGSCDDEICEDTLVCSISSKEIQTTNIEIHPEPNSFDSISEIAHVENSQKGASTESIENCHAFKSSIVFPRKSESECNLQDLSMRVNTKLTYKLPPFRPILSRSLSSICTRILNATTGDPKIVENGRDSIVHTGSEILSIYDSKSSFESEIIDLNFGDESSFQITQSDMDSAPGDSISPRGFTTSDEENDEMDSIHLE